MNNKQLAMKQEATNHSQTFLYVATENMYYCFLQAQVIKAIKTQDPDTKHIVVPCFGIRYHESDESRKMPRILKRAQISLKEYRKEQSRAAQCQKHFRHFLGKELAEEIVFVTQNCWLKQLLKAKCQASATGGGKSVETKCESLVIKGILCGDICADSFMRYKPETCAKTKDKFFAKLVIRATALIDFYRVIIRRFKPTILIGTDTTYIHHGVPHRVAAKANIPSISLAGLEQNFKLNLNKSPYNLTRASQPSYCKDYPNYHASRNSKIPKLIYEKASKSLERRVANIYDGTFTYMNKDLANRSDNANSCKGRVLVMLHDFFDASNIYRWKIFSDFYEWATSTISFCIENNIPVAVKPHPAQIDESEKVVEKLKHKYSMSEEILWINKSQKNSSLFKSNPALLVSMYGSVAAEATYAGIPVLLAGDHPGINFEVGYTASSKKEYFEYLSYYGQARKGNKEDAINFTAQHYYNNFARKSDSLKSRMSQSEDSWNHYENYNNSEITDYTNEFRKELVEILRKECLLKQKKTNTELT